jgi:hypothetical protein
MHTVTTIGLDIAKSVFQVHGFDATGQVIIRRQLKRRCVLTHILLVRCVRRRRAAKLGCGHNMPLALSQDRQVSGGTTQFVVSIYFL